ncbi:MAG: ABC transporter permease [Cytophagia bacterium]|nr:MAG: ABC transporter permease [Cytophagales bacterium]TAG38801.1 MAG: ABC transporter permease [Cytophagia bacterium]
MLRNYLKIALRNLVNNKVYSAINILGLSFGMTCTILITLWIYDEITYDEFHQNKQQIFKVFANRTFNNQTFTDQNMVLPLAGTLEKNSALVKNAVVITHPQDRVMIYKDTKIKKNGHRVSNHFFDMFSWKALNGNPKSIFQDPNSIVLSQSTAEAIFGKTDPINQIIRLPGDNINVKVVAVVEDVPQNSTIEFDYILPFNYADEDTKRAMTNWYNSSWQVFVQTNNNANISQLENQINQIKYQNSADDRAISKYFAFPFLKLHLHGEFKEGKNVGGLIEYVRLFGVIALFILLIACINFMNLSTARSEKRSKEVGIRKAVGSNKTQLVFQFFSESILIVLISFAVSIISVVLLLPIFNQLVEKTITLNFTNPYFWLAALLIISVTGIVAGSYPSLYLSSFAPIKVLKGTIRMGKNATLPRKILVIGQFTISIILISATIIVYRQINHIKDRNMGYNQEKLIMVESSSEIQRNYMALKDELIKTSAVKSINRSFSPITDIWWSSPAPDWKGKPAKADFLVNMMAVDVDFTKTMGIKMIEGKDFSGMPSDSAAVLINKSAVKILGLKNPIGTVFRQGKQENTVIGIMDDFIMDSPFKTIDPLFVFYSSRNINTINIRLNESVPTEQSLAGIESIFKKYNPEYPFEFQFVNEEYAKKYGAEQRIGNLALIFSILAIFISCLGLFGLASFIAEQRTKEIGIRKVLGASVANLWQLLSKDFVILVIISCLIAAPIAYYFMSEWLQKYTYRTEISWWIFVVAGVGALVITLLTVSYQAIKAALMNPVKSLKTE